MEHHLWYLQGKAYNRYKKIMEPLFAKKNVIFYSLLISTLIIASFFLFYNLDDRYLWKDEAETALLAKSILSEGIPKSKIGQNTIHIHLDSYLRSDGVWTYHPWLQFYITALSFKLFGHSTVSARMPFALIGFLSLLALFWFTFQLTNKREIALLSVIFLTFSVPFVLHMRECRYYASTVFFTILLLMSYVSFLKHQRYSGFLVLLFSNLLFHSNYAAFIPVNCALILHYFLFFRKDEWFKKFIILQVLIFITTFPWFLYLNGFQHTHKLLTWKELRHNIAFYFRSTYKFMYPFICFAILEIYFYIRKKSLVLCSSFNLLKKEYFWLLSFVFMFTYLIAFIGEQRYFRYIIFLMPIYAIFLGLNFYSLFKFNKKIAGFICILVLSTNLLHYNLPIFFLKQFKPLLDSKILPEKLMNKINNTHFMPLKEYVYELTHPFLDSDKEIVNFFQKNAKVGDSIGIPYGDHTLMFYTDFKIVNMMFYKNSFPDWIVLQRPWFEDVYGNVDESPYFAEIEKHYEKIQTDIPDVRWSHRPDPSSMSFRDNKTSLKLAIYKKKS